MVDCNGRKRGNCVESLPVAAAGSEPLAPFVVGVERGNDEKYGEDGEKKLHERPVNSGQ